MSERAEMLETMAIAGQALAVQWGHQPWSDSWAQQVAETMLNAAEAWEEDRERWTCDDCSCLNRSDESFCFRCGDGRPESDDN